MAQDIELLMAKTRKGDIRAFEKLYKLYHPRMFVYAHKFIADEEVVRDLLQDFFIDFWQNRSQLEVKSSLNAYLFRCIHNRCIDYLRSTSVRHDFVNLADLRLNEVKSQYFLDDANPLSSIFSEDIEAIIDKVMEELPEQCRKVFIMSRKQGSSTQEIANELDISPRTVESHVYRVLKTLKSHLTDYMTVLSVFFVLD